MSLRSRRPVLAVAFVLVLVAGAGCLGVGNASDVPDRDSVTDSLQSLDTMAGNLTVEQHIGNETTELHLEFVQRVSTGEFRASVYQESPDVRLRMVSNGSTLWVHNRSSNVVRRVDVENLGTQWNRSVESIASVFESIQQSSGDEDVSISPLPTVPGGSGSAGGAVGGASFPSMGNVSVSYQGTATMLDRETHAVDLSPATNESIVRNGTIWFDAEQYFPIKAQYSVNVGGRDGEITEEYRNVTYNPTVEEGAFTFEPPENATVSDRTESISTYQTRSELASAAEVSVPDPDLSEEYQFAQGSIIADGTNTTVSLQYSNGESTLVVAKRTPTSELSDVPEDATSEEATVAGNDGRLVETSTTRVLTWVCDGSRYAVTGDLSADRLQTIGESMACD